MFDQKIKILVLAISMLFLLLSQSRAEDLLIKKNLFSPDRKYFSTKKEDNNKVSVSEKEFKQNLILRGTYIIPNKKWAILEIKPALKRKLELKKTQIILEEGNSLDKCILKKIEEGKVLFGGRCNFELSLRDNPERKSLPEASKTPPNPFLKALKSKPPIKQGSPKNPFKALLEKKRGGARP